MIASIGTRFDHISETANMLVPSEEKVVTVTFMQHVRPEQIPETISAFADEKEHQEERPRPTQDITYTIEGAVELSSTLAFCRGVFG